MKAIIKPLAMKGMSLLLLGLVAVAVLGVSYSFTLLYQGVFCDYWRGSAPNGWYHQQEAIAPYMIVNGSVSFSMFDRSYLGPLHGNFRVADGVVFSSFPNIGRYDLRLRNNVIVEAVCYDPLPMVRI